MLKNNFLKSVEDSLISQSMDSLLFYHNRLWVLCLICDCALHLFRFFYPTHPTWQYKSTHTFMSSVPNDDQMESVTRHMEL